MNRSVFGRLMIVLGLPFLANFSIIVVPPMYQSKDVFGAFAAGFVNPYSTGYSIDAIICEVILIAWVIYERRALNIGYGWIVVPLSLVPVVATAFAFYPVIRSRQLETAKANI